MTLPKTVSREEQFAACGEERQGRSPSVDQMLAIARRYLPEEAARGFVKAELEHPSSELVLFTVRPDRWLTADFTEEVQR